MHKQLYIDGSWVGPVEGKNFAVINPATEEVIHHAPAATGKDVETAVAAARNAFDHGPWPGLSGRERATTLRLMATEVERRLDELARLEVLDNGKPLPEARWDIEDVAGCFNFYADLAEELEDKSSEPVKLSDESFISKAVKEPVGVAAAIIPWNFPLLMASWKVAPALAAGCSIVLKPSELTPLTALELGEIAQEAGLPPGTLNILTGTGPDAGQPLVDHPDIDKIAFTGSVPTGSKIMQAAASDIKNISLELGGKSPFIVFADSDLDKAVEWVMFGIFWNQGEVCSATSRVLVEEPLYDRLVNRLKEKVKEIRIGDGMQDGVLLGPLVSQSQYAKITAAVSRGISEGASLTCGGKRPDYLPKGYFLEPTIFEDVPTNSWIWREETFGPLVCLARFKTEEEALALANDTRYGLAAAVMSADESRCDRVASALRAGIVWVNCSQPTFTEAPWGGYKQSGIGRELGRWGLENYLETKQITRYINDRPFGWYLDP